MKIKLLVCVFVLLFALSSVAAPPADRLPRAFKGSAAMQVDNTTFIDANRILMFVTNHGNFGRDLSELFGYDYGTWFPYTGDTADISGNIGDAGRQSPYYAGGLWAGALDSATGEKLVIISEYSDEYVPGPMEGGTFMEDRAEFRVYKLYRDSLAGNPNQDYLDYLEFAVDQGAPVKEENGEIVPDMMGDQMCWSVFNDADPDQHNNSSGESAPMGIEVQNTTFAFDRQGALGNIIIIRLQIYNKGIKTLNQCYFSIWSDPDLGTAGDDLVGCDTTLGLGFVYNETNDDSQYGEAPPALGIDFFQGPMIDTLIDPTLTKLDTALMWGQKYPYSKNLGMTSFNKYINGTDPDDKDQTYNYMRGLTRTGEDYIYDGQVLKFVHSGDPVTGEGDLDAAGDDRRWMQTTGPIIFRPGDSTEIYAAIIVGRGNSNLNSVTVVKQLDDFAQQLYENGFNPPSPPAKPNVNLTQLHNEIILTWDDTSEINPGDFEFEGYSVWQGETASGPWTLLKTFDVINDRDVALVDSLTDLETGLVIPDIKRSLSNSGLTYAYTIDKDALLSEDLKDITTYFFRVTAFSFGYEFNGKPVPNQDRFLESQTVVVAQPQAPMAGLNFGADGNEILSVNHVAGVSDGIVDPIVTDPFALTGDSYRVDFGYDTVITDISDTLWIVDTTTLTDTCDVDWDPDGDSIIVTYCIQIDSSIDEVHDYQDIVISTFWNFHNLTKDTTYVSRNFNLSYDDNYQVYDGFWLKVSGPPLEGKDWDYTSADPPNLSPVAVDEQDYEGGRWVTGGQHGGELFFGGVFMEPNFWGLTSLAPDEYPIVEVRFRPMASYTDLNGDGVYTIGEPYEVDDPAQTQNAFSYSTFAGSAYLGFVPVPLTAWDVTDPANPRQLNVVFRDRDQNGQWDLHNIADPPDPLLPNDGDQRYNYLWILNTDYDATGTMYGDGTGGTIDFWGYEDGDGVWDAAWTMWVDDRGSGGMLAEECTFTMIPNFVITDADVFEFDAPAATVTYDESQLDAIKAVPNPFYLFGPYDPSIGSYQVCFHHLPEACTIDIYNLGGDLIRSIVKDDPTTAIACWDILTERGLPVASGIYIYVVEAPGFGTKIGKMAVFVEDEVLDIY